MSRLWPRGVRKSNVAIGRWLKETAPSTEPRCGFAHDPGRWDEFQRRYKAELSKDAGLLNEIRNIAKKGAITFAYPAHDETHNQAIVLRDVLTE